jgi:reverse gyrase
MSEKEVVRAICVACEAVVESERFVAGLCKGCWNDLDTLRIRVRNLHDGLLREERRTEHLEEANRELANSLRSVLREATVVESMNRALHAALDEAVSKR